jgi:hypothetical protein
VIVVGARRSPRWLEISTITMPSALIRVNRRDNAPRSVSRRRDMREQRGVELGRAR